MILSELLPEEKRRLHELELQLSELERGNASVADVTFRLNEMKDRLETLESLANKESKAYRDDSKRRVNQLVKRHDHVKVSLEMFIRRTNPSLLEQQRRDLFAGVDVEDAACRVVAPSEQELKEHDHLNSSSRMLNQYMEMGRETLTELTAQRGRLKAVQRKVLDIMNYLGLSKSVIRYVEQRENFDKWIAYGGMAGILLLLIAIWYFFRRK